MVTLSVAGGGCWRQEDGLLWLRIRGRQKADFHNDRLLLDKCLRSKGDLKKDIRVKLQGQTDEFIIFELWTSESSTDFLQFIGEWSVNLQQWIQSGAASRWYEVKKSRIRDRDSSSVVVNGSEYWESEAALKSSAYVCVGIVGVEETPAVESSQPDTTRLTKEAPGETEAQTFHFVLPNRSLTMSGKFRAIRVGQIVHELRTDILHDLLPLTLYGRTKTSRHQCSNSIRPDTPEDGRTKALVLLQLSCQYANFCVDELERYSSELDRRRTKLKVKVNRMKLRRKLLKEQKVNLQREIEVTNCSLEGLRSLLEELDPDTSARLHDECSTNHEEVKDTVT